MSRTTHRTVLLMALLAGLLSAGCREGKLNLRRAEDMSTAWLHSLEGFLNPAPTPQETQNAEAPEGAVEGEEAQNEEESEGEPDPTEPHCLRDCFVDDGWLPEGFKNPTEAIAWLTASQRVFGKVQSIDLVEGGAQIIFELRGDPPAVMTALIVRERSVPKCKRLQQAAAAATPAESTPAAARKTTSAPGKAPKSGQPEKHTATAKP